MPRRGIDLSEEQWRNVKSHAAKRGQTISEFFGDVIHEYGLGRKQTIPGGPLVDYPPAMTHVPVSTSIDSRATDHIRPGEPPTQTTSTGAASRIDVSTGSFGASRPAPKPARKK